MSLHNPHIESARTFIEGLPSATASEYLDFLERNRDRFEPTFPAKFLNVIYSTPYWQQAIDSCADDFSKQKMIRLIVRHRQSKEWIGTINFAEFRPFPDNSCSVGFLCDKKYVGQGFIQESLKAVFHWVQQETKVRRIYAYHLPENQRSAKTLNSLGFETVGLIKGYAQLSDHWHDHMMTSLILENSNRPI